jgi:DNA-binding MarR family transcriptional regulator
VLETTWRSPSSWSTSLTDTVYVSDDRAVAAIDLGRLLLGAHRALGAELVAGLEERGYPDARPAHASALLNIDRRSGSRLSDLAQRAHMTKQGMMLLVDDLEARGYMRRVPDPQDGRAKVVRLTARGRRYVAETRRTVVAMESRIRRQLGDRRYEVLLASLEAMTEEWE